MDSFIDRIRSSVSRETFDDLCTYVDLLNKWNARINLIGRSTSAVIWDRHIADSFQIDSIAPSDVRWVDIGSGAGFPGLVIAILRKSKDRTHVTLVESDQRKCVFMNAVAQAVGLNVDIQCRRIEEDPGNKFDVISARALAPLDKLLAMAAPYRAHDSLCIFPKGAKARQELTAARESFHIAAREVPSMTDSTASIICVEEYSLV